MLCTRLSQMIPVGNFVEFVTLSNQTRHYKQEFFITSYLKTFADKRIATDNYEV